MTKVQAKPVIFFVDDEPGIRKIVGCILMELGCQVECFETGARCLEALKKKNFCDVLIADFNMPEIDGLTLLKEAKSIIPWLPILIITGFGDIPLAVKAMKLGALNFIEKPLDKEQFLSAVRSALAESARLKSLMAEPLTPSEINILRLIVEGKSNSQIAYLIGRSIRTVEFHRNHLMHKLNADSPAALTKKAIALGLASVDQ